MKKKLKYIEGRKDLISESVFLQFIDSVSNDFVPPLRERIANLHEYYKKINENANFVLCKDNENIVGMIVFYCNDLTPLSAYTTILAVYPQYRRKGIASNLLNRACNYAKENKKQIMAIDTNNEYAKQCYLLLDFQIKSKIYLEKWNTIRYHMEKDL